jgi:hypothetical protein
MGTVSQDEASESLGCFCGADLWHSALGRLTIIRKAFEARMDRRTASEFLTQEAHFLRKQAAMPRRLKERAHLLRMARQMETAALN